MTRICSGAEMLAVEAEVITHNEVDAMLLMENAGASVVTAMMSFPLRGPIAVLCGTGNNGADGLVVARRLICLNSDLSVHVYIVSSRYKSFKSAEGRANLRRLEKLTNVVWISEIPSLAQYDLVVDALVGVSSATDDSLVLSMLEAMFASRAQLVAVDIPSVVCATHGTVLSTPTRPYALTVTFGHLKWGLLCYPGAALVGKLVLATISVPQFSQHKNVHTIDVPVLPARNPAGHKGSFGKGLFYCGSAGRYIGAPSFACGAFLKAGGGYCKLRMDRGEAVAALVPEIVLLLDEPPTGWADVVVLGCGSGPNFVLPPVSAPIVVIDGDGLTSLAGNMNFLKNDSTFVLTPHLGELRRLFPHEGSSLFDQVRVVKEALMKEFPNVIVVIKGPRSAVVSHSRTAVNLTGNSGMATPGSGDVLTGIIAAMVANSCGEDVIFEAVCNGVFVHGLAGDICKENLGEDGIMASDIMGAVPEAIRRIRAGHTGPLPFSIVV